MGLDFTQCYNDLYPMDINQCSRVTTIIKEKYINISTVVEKTFDKL